MKVRGFTLLELLLTLAILGILLSLSIPLIPVQTIRYDDCSLNFYHRMLELRELTYRTNCQYEIRFGPCKEIKLKKTGGTCRGSTYVTIYQQDNRDKYPKMKAIETIRFPSNFYLRYSGKMRKIRFDRNLTLGEASTLIFFDGSGRYKRKLTVDVWTNRIYLYKKEG